MIGLGGHIDFDKIILIGHSRGGDGAAIAAERNDGSIVKEKFKIQSVVVIAPTDNTGVIVPKEIPQLFLYGSADGDASFNNPLSMFDRKLGKTQFRSLGTTGFIFHYGGIHNWYNQFWTENDGAPGGMPVGKEAGVGPNDRDAHQTLAKSFIWSFLQQQFLFGGRPYYSEFFTRPSDLPSPDSILPPQLAQVVLHSDWDIDREPERIVENAQNSMRDPTINATGGTNVGHDLAFFQNKDLALFLPGFLAGQEKFPIEGNWNNDPAHFNNETRGLIAGWKKKTAFLRLDIKNGFDVSQTDFFKMRVTEHALDKLNAEANQKSFTIGLMDGSPEHNQLWTRSTAWTFIPRPYERKDRQTDSHVDWGNHLTRSVFKSLTIAHQRLAADGRKFDFSKVTTVIFVFDQTDQGQIGLDDVLFGR